MRERRRRRKFDREKERVRWEERNDEQENCSDVNFFMCYVFGGMETIFLVVTKKLLAQGRGSCCFSLSVDLYESLKP
jgi:hypothetical protein